MIESQEVETPNGWSWATVGEVTEAAIEQKAPEGQSNFLYVDISSIDNKTKRIVEPKSIPVSQAPSRARQQLKPNDVLVSMTRPNLNAVAMVPEGMQGAVGSTGFCVLRTNWLPASWLYYLVQTQDFIKAMSDLVQGVLYPAVRSRDITNYKIPIAPLTEQHRIVAEIEKQFTRLDAAVASLRRVQANLKRYRAAVFKAACEGRLVETDAALARTEQRTYEPAVELLQRTLRERRGRWEADQLAKMEAAGKLPKDDKWKSKYAEPSAPDTNTLPELPEGWTWCNLQMIAELKGGITKGQKRKPGEKVRSVPYLRVANVQRGFFDLREVKEIEATEGEIEELRLLVGDILFNEGGDRDKLGRGWVWQGEIGECIYQNHIFRARLVLSEMPPKYVSHYGNSEAQDYFMAQAKQTTNLASINLRKLGTLPIPLPPLAEQIRIVEEVERRLSIIDGLEKSIVVSLQRAETLRQKVLQDAFTGKLVERDPQDEPASLLLERIKVERIRSEAEEREKRKEERNILKKSGKTAMGERRKLIEVLRAAERPLTPETLFREASFKAEEVEAFYEELRQADKDGLIAEEKHPNGDVYLSARA